MTESALPPATTPPQRARVLSAWSIVSLVLTGLVMVFSLLPFYFVRNTSPAGPAEGAALTLLVYGCGIIALLCVLLGFFTGWAGTRRSRGGMVLAWAGMAIHGAILLLVAAAVFLAIVFVAWAAFISRASGG
jgi:hypothetical protein